MSYNGKNMTRVEGVPTKALYRYWTTDSTATVTASGYFDEAVTQYNLDTGDVIIATTGASGAAAVALLVVTNTAGAVTVASAA